MTDQEQETARNVLRSHKNWSSASYLTRIRALLWGRRETFDHLGKCGSIGWLGDRPYLLSIREG